MDILYAKKLWQYMKSNLVKEMYEAKIYSDGRKVRGFHEWADNRKVIGIISLHSKAYEEMLYFLILEWGRKDDIYLEPVPNLPISVACTMHRQIRQIPSRLTASKLSTPALFPV